MGKLIRHKWKALYGFKHHKCERCNCIRKWSDMGQRILYIDRFGNTFYQTPECELPNIRL